jgi:hypothetical protein
MLDFKIHRAQKHDVDPELYRQTEYLIDELKGSRKDGQ